MPRKTTRKKKKTKNVTPSGKAYITAGVNNTLITITDPAGNTLFANSSGKAGFKGTRKSTPYAATKAAELAAGDAVTAGMKDIAVIVNGPGIGRISAIKALKSTGLNIVSISDETPMPHNGCRPKKKRKM
ncbi:30S ribosomal protein S11 [Patescibacteria group bacterium]|nr:30S ribosomal protein S11 [Patescibacteria group bacterium]